MINANKNLSKKSSLQSQDRDSQPPESSEKLEFARPSDETLCQDKEKNTSQEDEMNKDDFQSGIISEINDFEIPIMIKPTFLNSERFQQGTVFEIKRERQNLNSSQSKHTRKTLSVINETK